MDWSSLEVISTICTAASYGFKTAMITLINTDFSGAICNAVGCGIRTGAITAIGN